LENSPSPPDRQVLLSRVVVVVVCYDVTIRKVESSTRQQRRASNENLTKNSRKMQPSVQIKVIKKCWRCYKYAHCAPDFANVQLSAVCSSYDREDTTCSSHDREDTTHKILSGDIFAKIINSLRSATLE
jgi:hypothetical protein